MHFTALICGGGVNSVPPLEADPVPAVLPATAAAVAATTMARATTRPRLVGCWSVLCLSFLGRRG
jgi:hypothetical protein